MVSGDSGVTRVVVVGAGIAGLAAAHHLADRPGVGVTVCESGPKVGGKVRTEDFAGVTLDLGPDAFLARRPEAVTLCRELGLVGELVPPATSSAFVWARGRLRRLPEGLVLGVPVRWGALARSRVLSPSGLARATIEPVLPGRKLGADEALGAVVRRRLGDQVHRTLVDPLVGGINAGDTDRLSIDMTAPVLAAAARGRRSLVRGAREVSAPGADRGGPAFLTLPGGLSRLVEVLVARLEASGVEVRTGAAVAAVERPDEGGYRLRMVSGALVEADAVIVAAPAYGAAPLLAPHAPTAAEALAGIEYASVALVAMAYPAPALPRRLDGSGFLVARGEGRLMSACSWASSKWAHLDPGDQVVLRVSAGRAGDARVESLDDDALVTRLSLELGLALGIGVPPSEVRVTRWARAFPQYAPGHLGRVAATEAELHRRLPGLALAGAALAGVGIPACIASGRRAADRVLASREDALRPTR